MTGTVKSACVTKRCVKLVPSRGEEPSESAENEAHQDGQEGHERGTLLASLPPETCGIKGRMNIRHAHRRPMSELIVMRHAKSDWGTGLPEFERPLSQRGHDDAPRWRNGSTTLAMCPTPC